MLLLDEPLGALDLKLRRQMQIELKRIQTEVGLTFVHVTHDQEEAMTMADTIAVMNAGRIEQLGAPAELYELPATDLRRQLPRPVQPARGHGDGHVRRTGSSPDMHGTSVLIALSRSACDDRTDVWLGIRPEKLHVGHRRRARRRPDVSRAGRHRRLVHRGRTQYLVRMPWGQELTSFEQNDGSTRVARPGHQRRARLGAPTTRSGSTPPRTRDAGVERRCESGAMSAVAAFERGTDPQQPPPAPRATAAAG